MEKAILDVFGAVVAACIFGGVLTAISLGLHKLFGKPFSMAQMISTFAVTALLFVAMIVFHHCSS